MFLEENLILMLNSMVKECVLWRDHDAGINWDHEGKGKIIVVLIIIHRNC